jgi:hypothetical protein
MPSYIPKQIKPVRERIEAKLDRELVLELEQFCEYLESDRDYVVAQALSVVFRKDKGFSAWKESHAIPQARGEEANRTPDSNGRSSK